MNNLKSSKDKLREAKAKRRSKRKKKAEQNADVGVGNLENTREKNEWRRDILDDFSASRGIEEFYPQDIPNRFPN